MKFDMVMPKMGESITEGTILKWLKQEGEQVEKDEIILEISTDKVDSEIPAPASGTITKLIAQEGETIDVGLPIAYIETDQDIKQAYAEEAVAAENEPEKKKDSVLKERPKNTGSRFYSPVVLNIAAEHQISGTELDAIPGNGLNGRVTKKDIIAYINSRDTEIKVKSISLKPGDRIEVVPMDHVRKSIARHMVDSKHTSPHVSIYSEVDMQNVVQIRESNKRAFEQREGIKLTFLPFIAKATSKALTEFPMVNASIEGDNIILKKYINLGIAVAADYGLIVPNIFDADSKSLTGLVRSIHDLVERARRKKLKPEEVQNGTFSISNFGVYGTTIGFPIINQPQVAILGVGALKKKPVVINDAIAIRSMMYLSLTFDHRLIDGMTGAQFLQRICQHLESYDRDLQL